MYKKTSIKIPVLRLIWNKEHIRKIFNFLLAMKSEFK